MISVKLSVAQKIDLDSVSVFGSIDISRNPCVSIRSVLRLSQDSLQSSMHFKSCFVYF